ncbi:hypothetical protein GCM10007385_14760 [Tateyamaria omphalii]|nr:hypothetical protein GCM10007385_14760 [Tateyamaria omphalii]
MADDRLRPKSNNRIPTKWGPSVIGLGSYPLIRPLRRSKGGSEAKGPHPLGT